MLDQIIASIPPQGIEEMLLAIYWDLSCHQLRAILNQCKDLTCEESIMVEIRDSRQAYELKKPGRTPQTYTVYNRIWRKN